MLNTSATEGADRIQFGPWKCRGFVAWVDVHAWQARNCRSSSGGCRAYGCGTHMGQSLNGYQSWVGRPKLLVVGDVDYHGMKVRLDLQAME